MPEISALAKSSPSRCVETELLKNPGPCPSLFARQHESGAAVFQYHAVAGDFVNLRTFIQARVFLVLIHVDKNKAFAWDVTVNMKVDVQVE